MRLRLYNVGPVGFLSSRRIRGTQLCIGANGLVKLYEPAKFYEIFSTCVEISTKFRVAATFYKNQYNFYSCRNSTDFS